MTEDTISLDLSPREITFSMGDKDYILREASGDAAIAYQNALIKAVRPGPDSKATQINTGLSAIEPMLVSKCLFDSEGKPVKQETIRSWPSRIQKELYKKVKEISELDEKPEEDDDDDNDDGDSKNE